VFPVRYGLDFYILFRRNSLFKGLNATGLRNLKYYYELLLSTTITNLTEIQ
jgi:hypothetical protein